MPDPIRAVRRVVSCATVAAAVLALAVAVPSRDAKADSAGRGGDFLALSPVGRLYDTRTGLGGAPANVDAGQTVSIKVLGVGGVPASAVSAVLLRITALAPSAATYLTVFPGGESLPGTSNLNVPAGSVGLTTSAMVSPGPDGTVSLFNSAGTVSVSASVDGYYTSGTVATGPGGFVPTTPTVVVDTRTGTGAAKAKLAAHASLPVQLTGSAIPNGAGSVFVDGIAVNATAAGEVSIGSGPAFNYVPGTTSAAIVAVPNASGQATFTNNGSTAIDLVLTVEGYGAGQSNVGSGLRTMTPQRLAAGISIAANATADVQVAGAGGLPTRAIKSVAMSLTVAGATQLGYVRAWPAGAAEPAPSSVNFPATDARAGLTYASPGSTGAIRFRNGSAATIKLYVDVLGWFSDPLPETPPRPQTPTSLIQMPSVGADPGQVELAYTDDSGQLYHGYQVDPSDFVNIRWTVEPGGETFSGQPSLTALGGGTVFAAVQRDDSEISSWSAKSGPDWNAPILDIGGSMASPPVTAALPDGSAVVFAVDVDGALWVYPLSASPRYWRNLGGVDLAGTPTLASIPGGLQIVAATSTGTVKTATYKSGVLSAWTDLGGERITGPVAVVTDQAAHLRIVARQGDAGVVTKAQSTAGTFPTGWSPVGTFAAGGAPAPVIDAATGAMLVFARNAVGYLYEADETGPGSGIWGPWLPVDGQGDAAATDPSMIQVTKMSNGWTWFGVYRTAGGASRVIVPKSLPTAAVSRSANRAGSVSPGGGASFAQSETYQLPSPPQRH